jgi:hypothetical protein
MIDALQDEKPYYLRTLDFICSNIIELELSDNYKFNYANANAEI